MTEDAARDRLILIGGYSNMLDMALKFLDGIETVMTPWTNVKTAALHVQAAAPRLVNVTNVTAISFDFLEGARLAIDRSSSVAEDVREIASHYSIECTSMIVIRLALLLDRDPAMASFQSVYRCLHHPEVVEELIRLMRDDPFQSERIEEDIRHYADKFIRTYHTIDWEFHGRMLHLRNLGLAHLGRGRLTKSITHEELRGLVQLVKDLAACLSPVTPYLPQIHQDETEDRITRGTAMWLAALSCDRAR